MPLRDQIKNYVRKPAEDKLEKFEIKTFVRNRKPLATNFRDDGIVPNNPHFPVLLYREAIAVRKSSANTAAIIDNIFEINGWGHSWRDTVYDFVHYHSQTHEVMGVAGGTAKVECGGIRGKIIQLKAGDILLLPAGTGHRLISSSRNFLVVGAYPEHGVYDECTDMRDRAEAAKRVSKPEKDPIYGAAGPMAQLWRR